MSMNRNRRLLGLALLCLGPLGRAAAQSGPSGSAANAPPPVGAARPVAQAQRFAPVPSWTGALELFMNRDWETSEEVVDFGPRPLPGDAYTSVSEDRLILYVNGFRKGDLALTAAIRGEIRDWQRERQDSQRCSFHRTHLLTLKEICHFWLSEREFVSIRWQVRGMSPKTGAPATVQLVARSYRLPEDPAAAMAGGLH